MNGDLSRLLARPIAHRGLHDASAGAVENSTTAAEAAVAAGFGIECDVVPSADGEAIVFHDETLERLTGRAGRVDGHSAAALSAIALRGGGGDTIPTLPAFLARVDGRVPVVVEIKSRFDGRFGLAARVVTLLATYRGPVALKSFDPAVLRECRRLGASCPIGLVGPADTEAITPSDTEPEFLSWRVGALHAVPPAWAGLPSMSWTVRSPDEHRRAARFGAQIVFEGYRPPLTPP